MLFLDVDSAAHCGMIAHRWRPVLDDKVRARPRPRGYSLTA
jgi:hypothetical protein